MTKSQYDFKNWTYKELIDIARVPPYDMEAAEWRTLAVELAAYAAKLKKALDRF